MACCLQRWFTRLPTVGASVPPSSANRAPPENVTLLSDILWSVLLPFCRTPVWPDMLNRPEHASLGTAVQNIGVYATNVLCVSHDDCCCAALCVTSKRSMRRLASFSFQASSTDSTLRSSLMALPVSKQRSHALIIRIVLSSVPIRYDFFSVFRFFVCFIVQLSS